MNNIYRQSLLSSVPLLASAFALAFVSTGAQAAESEKNAAVHAPAAEDADQSVNADGEIIVTAERRESSIQRVPVAVGVVGADDIQRGGIKRLWDANGAVAGLYLSSYPSNMQYVSIRGIGANDPGTFSAVGYYLDDVYLGRTFGRGQISLPDIERIEVLRGPQGTLYGQNTTGGAIKFVSRDPSLDTPFNWMSVSLGNLGAREAYAYLSTPISDKLSAAFAYAHRQNDGDTYNAFRNVDVNRLFVDQYRAKLRWAPTEALDIVLAVDGTIDSSDNFIPSPNNAPGVNRPRLVYANTDTQMHRNDFGQTLKIVYRLSDNLTLRSISANRRDRTNPHPWDSDGLSTDQFGWNQRFTEKVRSQEFQLSGDWSSLTFTLGANYYHETFDFDRLQWLNNVYTNLESHVKYDAYALYAQGNYRIAQGLGITLGGRFSWEKQQFDAASFRSNVSRARLATNYDVTGLSVNENGFTPKIGVDYQLTPAILTYASYTVGEKSGGFNRAAGTLAVASIPVSPEKVRTTEIGFKSQAFDRRITLNVAAFYNKFEDYQASVTNPVIGGAVVNGNVVVNAGDAHTKGIELETTIKPLPGLDLRGTATILRTKFDSFVNPTGAANADFTGNQVPNAPRFAGSGSFNYRFSPEAFPGSISLYGSVSYIQRNYIDIANTDALATDSQTYVNSGIDYQTEDEHWTLSFQVKNLFNKTYQLSATINPTLGVNNAGYNPPRTVLGTIRYQF